MDGKGRRTGAGHAWAGDRRPLQGGSLIDVSIYQIMITKHKISETSCTSVTSTSTSNRYRQCAVLPCHHTTARSRCDVSMPKLIHPSYRNHILGASNSNIIITKIDTIPRRTSSLLHVHAPSARTGTPATWHRYYTTARPEGQSRLHYTPSRTRLRHTWKRSPSSDYARHQQHRYFARGAYNQRGLGSRGRHDEWDSLPGIWDEEVEVDGTQDGYQAEAGEPQREVVKVNNGQIELE